jgi:hypothetical protein
MRRVAGRPIVAASAPVLAAVKVRAPARKATAATRVERVAAHVLLHRAIALAAVDPLIELRRLA